MLQWAGEPSGGSWTDSMLQRVRQIRAGSEEIEPGSISKTSSGFLQMKSAVSPHPKTLCLCLQVLHLVGLALLEEHQQLENSSGEDDITFNYTCKITRQYTKAILSKYSTMGKSEMILTLNHVSTPAQVLVQLQVHQAVFWLCWRVCKMLHIWKSTKT